ncbi:MAG: HAD-IA family hydrolase [Candidatus Nanoarchaeia archaeon]
MSAVEHLVFDLSEVLMNGIMDLPKAIEGAIYDKVPSFRQSSFPFDVHSDFFTLKENFLRQLFISQLSETEFFGNLLELRSYPLSVDELKVVTRQNFWQFDYSKCTLEKLRSKGYDLTLFSDHAREWVEYIESDFPILNIFDRRIYSFNSFYTKKEPESFEYLLETTSINPDKTLFIDDFPENIDNAKKSGIKHTHCFRGYERLVRHFRELEIKGYF